MLAVLLLVVVMISGMTLPRSKFFVPSAISYIKRIWTLLLSPFKPPVTRHLPAGFLLHGRDYFYIQCLAL